MMHSGTELELVSSSVTYVDSENNDPDYDVTSTTSSLESDDSSSTFNSFQHASRSPTPPSKRTSFLFATTKRMSFSFSPLNRSIASSSNNKVPSSPARSNKDVDEKRMLLELEAQEIERTQFVYLGKPTKSGQPVVYVVLHRLSLSYLRKPEAIALCIDKLFGTTAAATAATINNNNNNYNSNNFNNNNNNTSSHTSRTVSASGSPLGSTSSASPRQWSFPFASTSNNNNSSAQLEAPLKDLVNKQYVLVVDMSNCCGSAGEEEYYAALRDAVTTLAQRVSKSYYEKVSQVWVVQAPNRRLLKAVTSVIELATYNTKVNLAHTWSALGDILDMRDIMIPYVSKLCIPVTYRVIKADGFGRKQPRCLKLTNDSLLEIDEEGEVVNEIPLQLVEEIVSNSASDTEFLITTIAQQQNSAIPIITTLISSSGGSSGTASKSKGKAKNTTTNNNNGDLLDSATLEINPDERPSSPSHHFTCASAFEKEILVSALFEAAVKAGAMSQLQTFKGVKRIRITTSSNKSNNNNNNNTATIASAIKALSSPSSSSPTKAAASGKQQQRRGSLSSQATTTTTTTDDLIYTVKLTHDSIFLLVSDPPGVNSSGILSCQKEIPYSMIQCWFLTGSNNSHVLISYYSKAQAYFSQTNES